MRASSGPRWKSRTTSSGCQWASRTSKTCWLTSPKPSPEPMGCSASAIWDERYLAYDFGDHPLNPVRLELTIRMARELGVLDALNVLPPVAADEAALLTTHGAEYLAAVRQASVDPSFTGYGLGTDDDPVFAGMYEASALIAGGSALAAARVWSGQ